MEIIKNSGGKRVCDLSEDHKMIEIRQRDCITRISANPDGTLKIENMIAAAA